MSANKHRGEVTITLAGQQYVIRPTFQVIAAIEQATGKSLMAIAMAWGRNDVSLHEVAIIVHTAIRLQHQTRMTLGQVGDAIFDAGLGPVVMELLDFVTAAVGGGREAAVTDPPISPTVN